MSDPDRLAHLQLHKTCMNVLKYEPRRVIGLFPAPSIPDWDASLSPFFCHLVGLKRPKQKKEGPLVSAAKPKVLFHLSLP